jgi:hypothetical protein
MDLSLSRVAARVYASHHELGVPTMCLLTRGAMSAPRSV